MIWFAFVFCFLAAALLAGIESALVTVSRVRARHAADEGDKPAAKLAKLLEHRHELMRAAMTMHHLFTILAFVLLAFICRRIDAAWGIVIALAVAAPLFLVGLELAPKSLFRQFPFRLLKRCARPLALLRAIAVPLRLFGRRPAITAPLIPDPALLTVGRSALVREITALRLLPENSAALLSRYNDFAARSVRELAMTPDPRIMLRADMPLNEAIKQMQKTTLRHHPVVEAGGEIIGSLDAAALPHHPPADRLVRHFTQSVPALSGVDSALHCLQSLRQSGAPFASITRQDEQPVTIATLESILVRIMNLADKSGSSRK